MKILVALLLSVYCTHAATIWTACNTSGKVVTVSQAFDLATLLIPSPKSRPTYVAFLVEPRTADLSARTITTTFAIATTGAPVYGVGYTGGCATPANMRLYFTTVPGAYNLNDADRNPTHYWWCQPAAIAIGDADSGEIVTLTATVDPQYWSDANGQWAGDPAFTAAFLAALQHPAQVGFSFGGGCFYDTGVNVSNGTATLHLLSYSIQ